MQSGDTALSSGVTCSVGNLGRRHSRDRRNQALRRATALVAVAGGLAAIHSGPVAHAADITWTGTTNDFNTPTNWSSGSVPGTADNAIINNGGTVLYTPTTGNFTVNDLRAADAANSTGTYVQTGSTVTMNSWLRLGNSAGAVGNYQLTGGTIVVKGQMNVGESGTGVFNMSGGFVAASGGPVRTANNAAGRGTMNITGGTFNSSSEIWSGDFGNGAVNVNTAGTINLSNWLAVGRDNGTGVINIGPGGTFTKVAGTNGNITFAGATSTLNQTGGTLTNLGSETWIGEGPQSFYNMSGGVADLSELQLARNGGTTGTLNMTGGTLNAAEAAGNFRVGNNGTGTGIVNMTAGTINVGTAARGGGELWVGQSGAGVMNTSGGTVNVNSWLVVGRAGGTGTLNISGTAEVNKVAGTPNPMTIGTLVGAPAGSTTGTINQTGGTLNVTANESWIGENSVGVYNLTGGTGNLASTDIGHNGAGVGRLNVGGTGTLNVGALHVGRTDTAVGSANFSGGSVVAGSITVGSNGTASGTVNILPGSTVNVGTLLVAGGGSANGTLNHTGGTLNAAQIGRGNSFGTAVANLSNVTLASSTGVDNPTFITNFRAGELNLTNVTVNTGGNNIGVTGVISGPGPVVKTGGGTLTFSSPTGGSSFTGTVNVSTGTVRLAAPATLIPAANVIAYYPLNATAVDGFANVYYPDQSGHGNDLAQGGGGAGTQGTLTLSASAPAGHAGSTNFAGGAFLSPFTDSGFINNLPIGNSSYTIGTWVNLSAAANGTNPATPNNGTDGIVGWGNYGINNSVTAFRTANANATALNNYWFGNDLQANNPGTAALVGGNWHYVAVTYDAGKGAALGGSGLRTLYYDGQVIGSDDPILQHNALNFNFAVGVTNLGAGEYFSGNMTDLLIANTAFTPEQLAGAASSDNPFSLNSSGGQMSTATTVNVVGGATLDLNGNNQTIANLLGNGAVTLGAGTLTVNNTVAGQFNGTVAGTGGFNKSGAATFTLGGDGTNLTYTGRTTVNAGVLTFGANPSASSRLVRTFAGGITINGGTFAVPVSNTSAGRTVVVTNSLTLATVGTTGVFAGKLDLGNGDLILKGVSPAAAATNLATLQSAAAAGYAGGAFTATGLTSSVAAADSRHLTAVGVIPNNVGGSPLYTSFDGQTVTTSDVLARFTYYGDTNLDGAVNAGDYTRVDAGFVTNLTGWLNGDFNYDGRVDGSDYTLMDNAFNQQSGGVATPALSFASGGLVAAPAAVVAGVGSAVPEPTTAGLIAIGLVGLLGRRRRRSIVAR